MNILHPWTYGAHARLVILNFFSKKKPDPVLSFVTASEYKILYLLN